MVNDYKWFKDHVKNNLEDMIGTGSHNILQSIENILNAKVTKNEFLKIICTMGLGAFAAGCLKGVTQPKTYPLLPNNKIQAPENYGLEGCMTGIWLGWISHHQLKDKIKNYEEAVEKPLSYFILPYGSSYHSSVLNAHKGLNDDYLVQVAEMGIIPFISYEGDTYKIILDGLHDRWIIQSAKNLKKFGDVYGGFFIRTFREMNLPDSFSWNSDKHLFKDAWKHIWNIFDGEGANEYATWVFNPYIGDYGIAGNMYPGQKYVDWYGGNGYDIYLNISFSQLFSASTWIIKHKFKSHPLMVAETGTDKGSNKPRWTRQAFKAAKRLKLRGLSWWSQLWSNHNVTRMDSRIDSSPEALIAFREGISDDYFLGRIPYR